MEPVCRAPGVRRPLGCRGTAAEGGGCVPLGTSPGGGFQNAEFSVPEPGKSQANWVTLVTLVLPSTRRLRAVSHRSLLFTLGFRSQLPITPKSSSHSSRADDPSAEAVVLFASERWHCHSRGRVAVKPRFWEVTCYMKMAVVTQLLMS